MMTTEFSCFELLCMGFGVNTIFLFQRLLFGLLSVYLLLISYCSDKRAEYTATVLESCQYTMYI